MKKKEMLKEQKRLKAAKNEKYFDFSDMNYVKKVIMLVIGVILFIGFTYVLINIFKGTWTFLSRKNDEKVSYDSQLVMCGTIFNRADSEYLVMAYNFNEDNEAFYQALVDSYNGELPLYYLDLKSGFNKSCKSDTYNLVNDAEKIKFAMPTLLHIKNGKIVKSYITKETIKDYFNK